MDEAGLPKGSTFDICNILEMLQERLRCLCHDMQYPHPRLSSDQHIQSEFGIMGAHLHILDEPLQECHEMFRFTDIPRDSFLDHVIRKHCPSYQHTSPRRRGGDEPGFAMTSSSSRSRALFASCRPSTSFAYSSWSLLASVRLILHA